jgi:hypothetical protein
MDIFQSGVLDKTFAAIEEHGKEVMNWVVLLKNAEKK